MYNQSRAEIACRKVCEDVGMNYCKGASGWDAEVVSLADHVDFDQHDILSRPERVGRAITEYLDDLVRNP